jgi:hypothetical protein
MVLTAGLVCSKPQSHNVMALHPTILRVQQDILQANSQRKLPRFLGKLWAAHSEVAQ